MQSAASQYREAWSDFRNAQALILQDQRRYFLKMQQIQERYGAAIMDALWKTQEQKDTRTVPVMSAQEALLFIRARDGLTTFTKQDHARCLRWWYQRHCAGLRQTNNYQCEGTRS